MKNIKKKWFEFKMPHTYVILSILLIIVAILSNIIPGGEYDRVKDLATNKMIVVPDSFKYINKKTITFFDLFLMLQKGYVNASDIMFLIIFAYGFVYMFIKNGTLHGIIGYAIKKLGKKIELLIPFSMLLMGILGSTMGIYEEVYGLIPIFITISLTLGYDVIVGGAIVFIGTATGFAAATLNPFSIGIAQGIANIPLFSGILYRIIIFIVFEFVSICYVLKYARKIKANPEKSILYNENISTIEIKNSDYSLVLNLKQKFCVILFFITIFFLLVGTIKKGWYINEIAALFLMMMIIVGLVGGNTPTEIAKIFIESTKNLVSSMLIVGFTRGILLIMQEAKISDTIVFYLVGLLQNHSKYLSAIGMLGLQNIINFFITGSASQATITMPIIAPVSELIGFSKQISILAYQFGDGFSNMFWPTACALECGLIGVPLSKWYQFIWKLFFIMIFLQIFFILLAVFIGY